ncbi:MAG: biotin/lipoyl-binding protein, partial [Bacteroidetes bacterium]|nr:biotin/lipoyl-binding protein [Bacteroidota bacterium]
MTMIVSKNIMNIFLMIVMVGLVLAGCSGNQASIGNGAAPSQAMRVDYVVVHSRPVANKIEMTGTLLAAESALLSAQTSGLVKGIYFKEGEYASRGRLLVKLDDRQWLAQRKKLEAQLDIAQKDLTRKQKLLEIKGISQAEVD